MRVTLFIIFLSILLIGFSGTGRAGDPINYQVQSLYKEADPDSMKIYRIPIEVKLLDFSEDANWYKVKIEYSLGVVKFQFIGWTYIPVGEILNKRAEERQKSEKEVVQ